MKSLPINPFPVTSYLSDKYFCNREKETNILTVNVQNGLHTSLFAQRRIGKTGLIRHFFYHLKAKTTIKCLFVDIFSTQNQAQFTHVLSTEIFLTFPQGKGIGKKFMEVIKSFRPVISYDTFSGTPELSLDIADAKSKEKSIREIFRFLDSQKEPIVIAIDEFQQITEYPEQNTEALLRTIMQEMKYVTFIFCGSNLRIMTELFHNSKRPFYASCKSMYLGKIDESDYASFITHHFTEGKRKISEESIRFILDWTCRHTWYTQYLCNQIYASGKPTLDLATVQLICKDIFEQEQMVFFQYRKLLTSDQWNLLTAMAKEQKVTQPYSNTFIARYNLKSSANVKRSLESLLEKEMLYTEEASDGTFYEVYDKFLMRWLQVYG